MTIAGTKYYARPGNVLPSSGQSFSSYWMLISGMTILMFVIYIAANGQLQGWINLLVYSTPSTVQPSGSSGTTTAPEVTSPATTFGTGLGQTIAKTMGLTGPVSQSIAGSIGGAVLN